MGNGKWQPETESFFSLEGQFLRLKLSDGYKIKSLWLGTPDGEYCIKLSKSARASIGWVLRPGEQIQVLGQKKVDAKTGEIKFKADRVTWQGEPTPQTIPLASRPTSATILLCQKSDCWNHGGKEICQALEATLRDRDLADRVKLQKTGCMKRCKAGPNLVVLPDKARYSMVHVHDIPALVDRHLTPKTTA
jgi:(2Fe-2S) ferredoxin